MNQIPALIRVFAYLSLLTVGGGMAAFPEMKILTVDVHKWLDFHQLIHLYSVGQLAPGPNMMMIVSIGDWARAESSGAIVVLIAFFGPTALLALVIGRAWTKLENWPWRLSIQQGLAPVSIGLLLAGTLSMAKGSVTGWTHRRHRSWRVADHVVAQGQSSIVGAGRRHRRRYRFHTEIASLAAVSLTSQPVACLHPGSGPMFIASFLLPSISSDFIPIEVLLFGGVMLVIIVLISRRRARPHRRPLQTQSGRQLACPRRYHPKFAIYIFASAILLMLLLHIAEACIWGVVLNKVGLIPNLRDSIYFSANTYTTIGYGLMILPQTGANSVPSWQFPDCSPSPGRPAKCSTSCRAARTRCRLSGDSGEKNGATASRHQPIGGGADASTLNVKRVPNVMTASTMKSRLTLPNRRLRPARAGLSGRPALVTALRVPARRLLPFLRRLFAGPAQTPYRARPLSLHLSARSRHLPGHSCG